MPLWGLTLNTGANTITNAGTLEAAAGDTLTVSSGVTNTGSLIANGTVDVAGAVTGAGTGTINNGGTLEFEAASSTAVSFVGTSGTTGLLNLQDSQAFSGSIAGMSASVPGDAVLCADISFATLTKSYNTTTHMLTLSDGSHTAHLDMIGTYTLASFHFSNVGGQVEFTDPASGQFAQAVAGFGTDQGSGSITTPPGQGATHENLIATSHA